MLKYYIEKGASVDMPPDQVTKLYIDHGKGEYRKSPFIIQAACAGGVDILRTLLDHGCKYNDQGYIGMSIKRKN
jgi:hypothetical protein